MNSSGIRFLLGLLVAPFCYSQATPKKDEAKPTVAKVSVLSRDEVRESLRVQRAESAARLSAIVKASPPVQVPKDSIRFDARSK